MWCSRFEGHRGATRRDQAQHRFRLKMSYSTSTLHLSTIDLPKTLSGEIQTMPLLYATHAVVSMLCMQSALHMDVLAHHGVLVHAQRTRQTQTASWGMDLIKCMHSQQLCTSASDQIFWPNYCRYTHSLHSLRPQSLQSQLQTSQFRPLDPTILGFRNWFGLGLGLGG